MSKKIIALVLAVLMTIGIFAIAEEEAIFSPVKGKALAINVLTTQGKWLRSTPEFGEDNKVVLCVTGVEVRIYTMLANNWWKVSTEVEGEKYEGYMYLNPIDRSVLDDEGNVVDMGWFFTEDTVENVPEFMQIISDAEAAFVEKLYSDEPEVTEEIEVKPL